jgi:hypothetical protein
MRQSDFSVALAVLFHVFDMKALTELKLKGNERKHDKEIGREKQCRNISHDSHIRSASNSP